jgi:cobyrinic acid a,c-diamide synthase
VIGDGLPPLGQHIAVARDRAFAFAYPHLLDGWRRAGATLTVFSPLADEAPDPSANAVYLPGGYPELHAGRLAANAAFLDGLRRHGGLVYGECGGYMVLGESLEDAGGTVHRMAGLLPVATSFARRERHLGYRRLRSLGGLPWPSLLSGHEFHYSSIAAEGPAERLFAAADASGQPLAAIGHRRGRAMGSYAHVIAPSPADAP